MTIRLNPYLGFRGNAREAIEFYHGIFGGDVAISTFAEFGAAQDPSENDLVMHAQLTAPGELVLMASDTPQHMNYTPGDNFSVSLSGGSDDTDTLRGYYEKLSEGGTVTMPLDMAPWGDWFGMLVDRFGVQWLVNIAGAAS
ncbi:VOC family protein [Galbitalea soli]|uniref:VOC family protein n=1 Tax=Galbitalea soli TaxID=1268042 RepID=A0A7C9TSE1_9MICO|nr:VOC family protein [Galbitalea soli]NEM91844.1 VOC family protein [Galbitalea soli]NYJ29322.1 PhnB protein [Galbitalea soli]